MENRNSIQEIDSPVQVDNSQQGKVNWPPRPEVFGDLLTPLEASMYLRLNETGMHTPESAARTLRYWRDRGELKATKFARHVWYRMVELDRFLQNKTEK
jgi:hypothetical protein